MGSHAFGTQHFSFHRGLTTLFAAVAIGADNAVTLKRFNRTKRTYEDAPTTEGIVPAGADGIRSITRTDTGTYKVVLQGAYQRLLAASVTTCSADGKATVQTVAIDTEHTDVNDSAAPTIAIVTLAPSTAEEGGSPVTTLEPTDPAKDELLIFAFTLDASSAS